MANRKNVFASFRFIEMSLKDKSRPGCSSNFDDDVLKSLIESNPLLQCTLELVNMLNTYKSTLGQILQTIEKVSKLSV